MNSDDILLWQDGFWCFRKELHRSLLRNNYYRAVRCSSDEGQKIISAGPANPFVPAYLPIWSSIEKPA